MRRPLLAAKFLLPSVRSTVVPRPRLFERLAVASGVRLITVVAPAGWGKTTLLAAWARELDPSNPVAWLTLDDADNEPVRFWTYVLSAIERVAPHLTQEALGALRAPGLDPVLPALESLLNACVTAPADCFLVLDDYHLLSDASIHASMEFLLSYLPAESLRVIIASRADPPLPLARLRARGELAEIRLGDLRCTPSEGAALIAAVAGGADAGDTEELVRRTEGWPAALQLAALGVRGASSPDSAGAARVDRPILDYFAAEVLPQLTETERDLLVRCSVLERLTGPLCDAVLQTSDSAAVLDRLARSDMFVTELGFEDAQKGTASSGAPAAGRSWYRCHQLFRRVLRQELDAAQPGSAADLLTRAAEWFLSAGQVEEAVGHLLLAGQDSAALSVLASHTRWFLEHGAMAALLRLGAGPAARIANPHLHLSLAFAAGLTGQPDQVARWLEAADPLITPDTPPLPGWRSLRAGADATWAGFALERDVDSALRHARRAVELESDPARWGYVVARQALAGALLAADQMGESLALLEESWRLPVRSELPLLLTLQHAGSLALALVESDRRDEARAVMAEVAEQAAEAEHAWGAGAAAALTALRLAQAELLSVSDPAAALPELRGAVALAEHWGQPTTLALALLVLAAAEWAAGERGAARQSLDRAGDLVAHETNSPAAIRRYHALEHRIGRSATTAARSRGMLREELTDRELSILRALRGPLSAREIASELYLSINTVKGYTKRLYLKLDVASRTDAVRRGHELGLI